MLTHPVEVLLIEDNQADIDLTREALSQQKMLMNLYVARTGEEGLGFLSRTGKFVSAVRPDLILLDLNLPGMDGLDVLKKIKTHPNFRQIPVVILTTSEADLDVLKSYSVGANCYIVKPVDFDSFSHIVMQLQDFWFSIVKLPIHKLAENYQVARSTRGSLFTQTIEPKKEIHVLYVEDSDADAELVSESLKSLSEPRYIFHRAIRLSDACDYLEAHSIDVVLLDLTLPDSQGIETVVRFLFREPTFPVIVLTGMEDKVLGVRAVQEGAQDYLVKGETESETLGRILLFAIERKNNVLKQIETLERELEIRDEAEKAVAIRDEFLSIATHELRTPLTSLKLQMHVLTKMLEDELKGEKDELLKKRLQDMAKKVDVQIDRFSQLVGKLLDFSRIQSGRLSLEYSDFDLNEIVRESVERLAPEFKEAGCEVSMNLGQPVIGEWDRLRLEQVLINLLSNGMKYARGKPIEVSVVSEGQSVRIQVMDQGPGIAPQNKERIFQRFERVEETKSISGIGLGLYVVRQIVNAHGGTIEVKSDLGAGSAFVVRLPMRAMGRLLTLRTA